MAASDAVIIDQQHMDDSGTLAELFAAADNAIERRRTENIFKQLDERSLTEDEEKIIQQRVELQRKLLQEYEKREQKRKVAELQEMWPDLSEAAALRALEVCNGKEEEAVLRLTEDASFRRRVMAETGTHTPSTIVVAQGKQTRNRGASSSRSTSTRIISPSQMGGRVFVGRFRSKLGPYQMTDPALQAALPTSGPEGAGLDAGLTTSAAAAAAGAAPAAAAAVPAQQPRKRGRPRKSESAAAAGVPPAAPAATAAVPELQAVEAAVAAAAALGGSSSAAAAATGPASAAAAAAAAIVDDAGVLHSSKRQRSSSPSSDAGDDAGDAATETEPEQDSAAAALAACTDSGADTDTGVVQRSSRQQDQQAPAAVHTDRVVSMMARQVARLEPLVAAGRLLEFEVRRPGSSPAVLELLAAEYGQQVSVPIATAWEVLLEEQKLNESMGLQTIAAASTAAAAAAMSFKPAQSAGSTGGQQQNAGTGSVSSPARPRNSPRQQQQPVPQAQEQQQQQQWELLQPEQEQHHDQHLQGHMLQEAAAAAAAVAVAAAAAAAAFEASYANASAAAAAAAGAPAYSDASTVSDQLAGFIHDPAAAAAAAAGTPTSEAAAAAAGAAGSSGRGRRAAAAAAAAVSAAPATEAGSSRAKGKSSSSGSKGTGGGGSRTASRAISETGHTCRGRVRQKSHKTTELVEVGQLVVAKDWFNAGYIFPAGFKSRLLFRSSIDTDALCLHECEITGQGGKFWPAPTFTVTARDREDEPVVAKSCTGCWSQILKRINATISQRIAAGENLPPPPRTAIAGPEYFGLNDLSTIAAIEKLDPEHLCTTYWFGKEQREMASAGLPIVVQPRANSSSGRGAGGGGSSGRKRGRPRADDADADDEGEEAGYKGNHWSAISRRERYLKRCTDAGDEVPPDSDQDLLPGVLDPVTLEPVVNPAISPAGHVMGLATWKAVLSETGRCPFTKAPLRVDMLTVLTVNNIEKHRARIVAMS